MVALEILIAFRMGCVRETYMGGGALYPVILLFVVIIYC